MRRAPYVWAALAAVACGVLLCVLGWYGASGERFTARQVPYLASCTVPGAALIVAGAVAAAVLLSGAMPEVRQEYAAPDAEAPPVSRLPHAEGPLTHLPGGTLAHRQDCPLVLGKPEAEPAAGVRDLAPCPICEPDFPSRGPEPAERPAHGPESAERPAHGPESAD
ncbi:hypothetical protein OG897_11945 [Streptomyces sp. NBC_00237]|uniref:hypothetical protein n=1 Tax=Streptomyces sp. NBC_00237 TaxID=2975687 RepID=UPI002256C11C|nr:hypothetical protein [Streptomyces sp. NBC_00237]MCX5202159.1 hypothetical protein [Streptomyces sp. NBC_00237]